MFDDFGRLDIFESFRVDSNLPKFKREKEESENSAVFGSSRIRLTSGEIMVGPNPLAGWTSKTPGFGWLAKLVSVFKKAEHPPVPIVEFFKSVKNSAEEIEIVERRASGYEAAIESARLCGQTALVEQLEKLVVAVRAETQLFAIGLKTYLEENRLVEFMKKTEKGLRLDWVANFTRFIPKHVILQKHNADERGIFDNYVVLHHDPDGKSWSDLFFLA